MKEELLTHYDFDRPDKFSFENLRSLDSIANAFARNFSTNLSAFLRMPAEIEVSKVEQVPFGTDFLEKRKKDEFVFCTTHFADKEQILVQFDVGFILGVHNKQLGGVIGTTEKIKKSITIMEKLTVEHLLDEYVYPPLKDAFKTVGQFNFNLVEIETDPQYAKVTLPQDMVAMITFDVRFGTNQTSIQLAIPYLSIETYIEKLNVDNVLKHREDETPPEQGAYLLDHLHQINQWFEVELGQVDITLKELLELEPGTTLVLDPLAQPVKCLVGGKPKFHARIGSSEQKKAVKIVGMAQKNPIGKEPKGELADE